MKSITRFTLWFTLNSTLAASAYFGYIENNENAKNVMQFLVFFVTLPISLIALTDEYVKKAAEYKENDSNKFRSLISHAIDFFALGCLVWSGSFITAAVWAFGLLAAIASAESVKKLREAAEKSS